MDLLVVLSVCFTSLLTTAKSCPAQVKVALQQVSAVARPTGEVILRCDLSGVSIKEVEFYWWLIDETNSPIFIFSEKHDINETSVGFSSMLTKETHVFNEHGITTQLHLAVNMSITNRFRCEFTLRDNSVCEENTVIKFQDPNISIAFLKIPEAGGSRSYSIEETITCLVNATAGQPTFRLLYNGPDKSVFNITRQVLQLDNQEYYYNGIKYATVTLPQRGDIVCQVTDKLGTYRETKHIDTEVCAGGGHLSIAQEAAVKRPNGEAVLTCNATGISGSAVHTYRWIDHNSHTPIYVFPNDNSSSQISGNKNVVVDETHLFLENGLVTKIRLAVNIAMKSTYGCEIIMRDKSFCSKIVTVHYEDPVILISLQESDAHFDETPHVKLIDTVCVVNLAAGQPEFRLICNDSDRFVLLSENVRMTNRSGYFNGVLHVTAIVPLDGRITYTVTDDLGNYHKSMSIDINDKYDTKGQSLSTSFLINIINSILMVIIILLQAVAVFMYKRYSCRRRRFCSGSAETDERMEMLDMTL